MDNLARLKLRTNEPDDAILEDCLESAKAAIMARRYPFQEWPDELESPVSGFAVPGWLLQFTTSRAVNLKLLTLKTACPGLTVRRGFHRNFF